MWYTRTVLDGKKICQCPNCNSPFPYGPFFDHHGSQCPSCKISLVELQINGDLILIDQENAPEIVKNLILYINKLNEHDAFDELLVLMEFLGVEIKSRF